MSSEVINIKSEEKMYLVNADGEIVNEIDASESRVIVQSLEKMEKGGSSLSKLENSKRVKFKFAKINTTVLGDVRRVAPFFIELIPYVSYFDNILRFDNGVKINSANMGLVYGERNVSKQYANRVIKALVEEDIVHRYGKGKKSYLVVNPWICHCGRTVQTDVVEEFKDTKWKRGDY